MRKALVLLLALVAGLLIVPGAAYADVTVKVAVVRTPQQNGGRPDSLAQIAARTLGGDQGRAQEIFDLNKGRPQADGGALTDPAAITPGWILRLPDDASGPDVQIGKIAGDAGDAVNPEKSYFTWKVVLALVGAVVLALLTMLVVFRRRIVRWTRDRFHRAAEASRLRKRLQASVRTRDRVATEFAQDRVTPELVHRSAAELDSAHVEAYALRAGVHGVTAWVTADADPVPPWRAAGDGVWVREGGESRIGERSEGTAVPCLVRVGGGPEGMLFADLTWLDGVLAIGGDAGVAADVLAGLLTDLGQFRRDVQVIAVGPDVPGLPAQAVRLRSVADLRPAPPASGGDDGMVLLAARRRVLTGLVVMAGPLSPDEAAHLLAVTRDSTYAAVVLGDLPGAHWRWDARPDGEVHLPVFDATAVVPARRTR